MSLLRWVVKYEGCNVEGRGTQSDTSSPSSEGGRGRPFCHPYSISQCLPHLRMVAPSPGLRLF
eukprot:5770609-Pyramimonas_sp.AAC.1